MKHRKPRPPAPTSSGLPATYIEAEEDLIFRSVRKWWELRGPLLTGEALHADLVAGCLKLLTHPEDAEDAALVVRAARGGHPAADAALVRFTKAAIDADQFQQMPVAVRAYAGERHGKAQLAAGYSSKVPQTAIHYGRDIAVCYCIALVRTRYPAVPLYKAKRGRRSAADLVGQAFGLGEDQARRIHQTDGGIAEKLAKFFLWPVGKTVTNDFASNV